MKIPYSQKCYEHALEEQKQRSPFMITKVANTTARRAGQIRGLVIEHHVAAWFRKFYPFQYLEADNYQQWTKYCAHDFKLKISSRIYHIDVAGPRKDGTFGSYQLKPKAGVDFHILANALGFTSWDQIDFWQGFEIIGVVKSEDFVMKILSKNIIPFYDWLKMIHL
jgi:hypothetical protein